jgi:hypothetical protein
VIAYVKGVGALWNLRFDIYIEVDNSKLTVIKSSIR